MKKSAENLWGRFVVALFLLLSVASCSKSVDDIVLATPENPLKSTTLSGNKIVAPSYGCYTGVAIWTVENNVGLLDNFISTTGKTPNFVMFFSHWEDNYDKNFNTAGCEAIYQRGCIPYITWCPSSDYGDANQPKYKLTNITNGTHDAYITQYANAVKSWGKPVMLRFGMEMNTNWLPWCGNVNGNNNGSDFVNAWRYVYNKFASLGVTNVTWLWCPYVESLWNWGDMMLYYPGSAYVDWVGCDGYAYTPGTFGNGTFEQTFQSTLNKLISTGKPLMLGEIAAGEYSSDGNWKANWMYDAFNRIKNNYPIKALAWFNYNKEQDWRVESSSNSITAYKTKVTNDSYFLSGGVSSPNRKIALKALVNNKFVCADNYGNNALIAKSAAASTWEQFYLIDLGGGKVALQAVVNNKYVCADNYGNNALIAKSAAINTWEQFNITYYANNVISLKAVVNGKFVCADNYGNNPLIAKSAAASTWEQFTMVNQ